MIGLIVYQMAPVFQNKKGIEVIESIRACLILLECIEIEYVVGLEIEIKGLFVSLE